jgi:hypothetical protein
MLATSNTAGWAVPQADSASAHVAGGQAGPLRVDQAEERRRASAHAAGQAGPLRPDQADRRPVGRDND